MYSKDVAFLKYVTKATAPIETQLRLNHLSQITFTQTLIRETGWGRRTEKIPLARLNSLTHA